MIRLEPPVIAVPLSEATSGSVIQYGTTLGICAITARKDKIIASYDPGSFRFVWNTADVPSDVLVFGGELVLRPDLGTQFDDVRADASATNQLFMDRDKAKVVVHVGTEFRLLDLSTGEIESRPRTSPMSGFRKWSLGVYIQGALPAFVALLTV